jgi:hypothetical protein
MPATIDDPAILDEISEVLVKRGIKQERLTLLIVHVNVPPFRRSPGP